MAGKDSQAQTGGKSGVVAVTSDAWTGLHRPLARTLGKRTATQLGKLGLHTVGDLAYHFPFRYATRGQLMPLREIAEGESVTVIARVESTNLRPMNARRGFILKVDISDGARMLGLTFFGKSAGPLKYHETRLQPGQTAIFSGTVSSYRGQLQLTHPDYELIEDEATLATDIARLARPIPIYHATAALPSWKIQRAVATILPGLQASDFPDPLPAQYREKHGLPGKYEAVLALHEPRDENAWRVARARMKHEEAFVLQAALAQRSARTAQRETAAYPLRTGGILDAFDAALPYTLTAGQQSVGAEISADLARTAPMQRLLQGDVGSGKTVVALRAMLQVVDGGGQAALLAPTEVLAQQHYRSINELLGRLAWDVRCELLTGSMRASTKRTVLARLASGEAGIVIGTHALLSDTVSLPFLGLAVVDEQHRFGVDQRDRLARGVHTLVMTATPIPRTIAMTVFGDLAISTLKDMPAGRAGITTSLVPAANTPWIARAWQRAREEIAAGGRVYVVCPRIDATAEENTGASAGAADTAGPELASVVETAARLRALPQLAGIDIAVMHGRLETEEKNRVMARFASGESPLLVSTTVIEVGVDVPEATMMVILDADRFGISQLHQLRGRIGRGSKPGICLAISNAEPGSVAHSRLEAFASTTDGFALAEKDVELRAEGDVLGSSQAGRSSHLRFLSVVNDKAIVEQARAAAKAEVASDPELSAHTALAEAIAELDTERADYMERG
ncbi:ATP-dependent DNA helicase RecG [Actinobaculum suis]|uniref:Probable DNA 3'-5' helicase RecG n=1 Tax=Actinobaculum suis TaxID=1657 RepID=A0A1G7E227_9ACTO|nr:ATP-dependent DNA helicase RecG [Actinobaculum suis]MDY5153278.1 ATP-dependent DNA helicase RecG [Actinobaculum suis]SDE57536.1 ATP-dependent DNA helicase RecG [Actinobaculum suis]